MTKEKSKRNWFEFMNVADDSAEISIYDEIGLWGITAKDFKDELDALGDVSNLTLFINSPGGEVFTGFSIYNILNRHKASIEVRVDGIAASIASVIAMAGDKIVMAENSMMMIHNPTGFVIGDSRDMRQIANALDKMKNSIIGIYAKKTGQDRDDIWDIMDEEVWLDAQEAVDGGFADEVSDAVEFANKFDLSKFVNAPDMGNKKRGNSAPRNNGGGHMTEPKDKGKEPEKDIPSSDQPNNSGKTETVETEAQMRDRISKEMKNHRTDVARACKNAGKPELIDEYIDSGKSLSEVLEDLENKAKEDDEADKDNKSKSARNKARKDDPEISNRHSPGEGEGGDGGALDTNSIYNKWNGSGKGKGRAA